jgi:hypothetical protein
MVAQWLGSMHRMNRPVNMDSVISISQSLHSLLFPQPRQPHAER